MAQSETVERILDAAEQLFAEKGFAETSLRLITSKAGVNLAFPRAVLCQPGA
jgi:AcrR family transcriptional regulator